MTDIEKATKLFRDAGLGFPAIPEELAAQIKERGPWVYSTRPVELPPYNLQQYVKEVERTQTKDYVVLSHSGHGVNSYAIQYYLVQGPLRMFLHLAWGGVYMKEKEAAATIRNCFSIADQIVEAAQTVGRFQAGEHLTAVGSDFYGSYWSPPGESRRRREARGRGFLDSKPLQVLAEAHGWLANSNEGDVYRQM